MENIEKEWYLEKYLNETEIMKIIKRCRIDTSLKIHILEFNDCKKKDC